MTRSAFSRVLVASSMSLLAAGALADERPGNLWQTTSQMVMPGMPFSPPPNTTKLCTAKEWTQPPPPPPGQSCTVSNFERTDTTVSWDTQCTGEMEMSGHGEITFTSADAYTGTIEFAAEGMTITMNLTGEKIDECDDPIGP
jgi:hypothetical protein